MIIILNERKRAEEILEQGEIGSKPTSTLFLLGKYYRRHLDLKPKQTAERLHAFMEKNYTNYNPDLWEGTLENISLKANRYLLHEVDHIQVTKKELDAIRLLNHIETEKIVFSILCYAKLHNAFSIYNNDWCNCRLNELFRQARVTARHKKDKLLLLNDILSRKLLTLPDELGQLKKEALIGISMKNENLNLKVNFIDPIGEAKIKIYDFRELGYEYLSFLGENFARCKKCNVLFRQNRTKTALYCRKHRGYESVQKKIIHCLDCGCPVTVESRDNKTCRCSPCKEEYRKRYQRELMRKKRVK